MLALTSGGNLYNLTSFAPTILVLYITLEYNSYSLDYHLVLPFRQSNVDTLLRPLCTEIVWRYT
jgi:hypothetical protein